MTDFEDFQAFLTRRLAAAVAYVNANPEPLGELSARSGTASFFGPGGDRVTGAVAVWERYARDAAGFEGGETSFEILDAGASGGLAFWVGLQRATVRLKGRAGDARFDLRVTEVYRREDGEWRMVHRHASPLREDG